MKEIIIGVYFLKKRGKIIYVGQSTDILKRIYQHRYNKIDFDSYDYITCDTDALRELEKELIKKHCPKLNKVHNRKIKTEPMQIKVNGKDKELIRAAADKQGVTMSVYVLSAAMNKAKREMR